MSVDPAAAALPSRPSPGAAGARLGELYAAHSRMVYGICRMLLRDADEAEDATQQVFLAAYSNLLGGTEVRDPPAWLGTIARNACRRRAAVRMREPRPVDDEVTLVAPAADEAAISREEAAALYAQLAGLPAKQREAVVLRDLYGLRYDEVAKALGTSRPAVEALLFRGRRQLKRRLRPGVAAGVLAVPLAIQESIAYAVPGFASTAAPAGAAAVAAGIPLVAKLATAGAAAALAGSAGLVADRSLHDPPARPAAAKAELVRPAAAVVAEPSPPALLPVPAGGFPIVSRSRKDDNSGPGGGGVETARGAGAADDNHNEGKGKADDDPVETAREDNSGPGGGGEPGDVEDVAPALAVEDHSGPGDGAEPAEADTDSSGSSGSSGKGEDDDAGRASNGESDGESG
jgi:RNA polymerase sigma-70 factor (ECF subfamily)